MQREAYNRIVEAIYDAALDPQHWQNAVTLIKDEFRSLAAGFFVENSHILQEFFFIGIEDDQVEIYGKHFAAINPWYTVPGLMREGCVSTDRSLERMYKDEKAFIKTEMYQDWCLKQDFRHALGSNLLDNSGSKINFTFFRAKHEGHYTGAEITGYQSLSRHLLKAVELNTKVRDTFAQASLKEHALDTLRVGVILLGSDKRVLFVNHYAQKFLLPGQGLSLKSSRLSSFPPKNAAMINSALEEACRHARSVTFCIPRRGRSSLSLSIVPQTRRSNIFGVSNLYTAVFISDPDDREIGSAAYLQARWQLTPLEAGFCLHLLRGCAIPEIAQYLNLTLNTAEWYSKQIRGKLGVKRQSSVVSLLLNDVGSFLQTKSFED